MKSIFYFLSLYFLTVSIYAAEIPQTETAERVAVTSKEWVTTESEEAQEWVLIAASQAGQIISGETKREIPPAILEQFRKMIRGMTDSASIDDVPIEIFLQEPAFLRSILVSGGFYLKSTAITAANLYAWLSPFNFSAILRSVSTPAVYSYAHKVTEGDVINFPEISLNYVWELLDDVLDRKTFAKFPLRKRAFRFDTNGFNGLGKGYDGYAIIQDFAYGERLVCPGEEYAEISKDLEKNPLDCLVSLKEYIKLKEWLGDRFVRANPMNLRKVGSTFKDMFGNTCLLYEVPAPPQSLFLLVIRKPAKEYLDMHEIWKEVWRRNQEDKPISKGNTGAAEGVETKK